MQEKLENKHTNFISIIIFYCTFLQLYTHFLNILYSLKSKDAEGPQGLQGPLSYDGNYFL